MCPRPILPRLCPSSAVIATTDPALLGAAVPIAGVAGDQQAALFGQGAWRPGDCKNTYGTGCFLLMNVGPPPAPPEQGLLSTVGWVLGPEAGAGTGAARAAAAGWSAGASVTYALEGSVFMGGGAAQWLHEALGIIAAPADIGPLAARAADNGGVYFVPALTGLGAPYWDPYARGLLIGLTRGTRPEHLARATEEAICLQTRAVLEAMRADVGSRHHRSAGRRRSRRRRLLAATAGRPAGHAGGAAPHARDHGSGRRRPGRAGGGLLVTDDIAGLAGTDRIFTPAMAPEERDRLYQEWQRAVERSLGWVV